MYEPGSQTKANLHDLFWTFFRVKEWKHTVCCFVKGNLTVLKGG